MTRTLTALALLLVSCAQPVEGEVGERVNLLDARSQLIRLSVDLRGVHPTLEELEAIETTPDLYGSFVTAYMEDPRFLERIEEIYNHTIRTRTGATYFDCLLYTSPSPRDQRGSRMPSSA